MAKLEAVILDWAGTAVDYGCFAPVQGFVEAFEQFGITPTMEEVREPMGRLKWDHIHTMMQMPRIRAEWQRTQGRDWTREDVDRVYEVSEGLILSLLHRYAEPKPHLLEAVAGLRERGLKIGSTTGYTGEMMAIVTAGAAEKGYRPDCWFSPDAVGNAGRPYPYMVFRNLEALGVSRVQAAIKVGDTVSDIREGQNAGLLTVGILEGSSLMGRTQAEYEALTPAEQQAECDRVRRVYEGCGADYIIRDLSELCPLIDRMAQGE